MSADTAAKAGTPHLQAASLACAIVTGILWAGRIAAVHWEHATLTEFAPEPFPIKNLGLALQRVAAATPSVLPLYGSSEMVMRADNKAGEFFRDAPTGFEVSPVGAGGTTSIIILQKLAALAPDLQGKKIAISLSPSWFFRKTANPDFYGGNFSAMAASEFAFGTNVGMELKREIATRMLQFPESLKKEPLLGLAITCLASQRRSDRLLLWALWPLGKLENIIFDLQDHFEAVVRLRHVPKPKGPPHPSMANPIAKHESQASPLDDDVRRGGDPVFLEHMANAMEWSDLDLLLRTITEIHARPLLLCIPLDGSLYEEAGISRSARQQFYTTLQAHADRYHFPLVAFEEHDEDPAFLVAHHYHLSGAGWMSYDQALDAFFHDQPVNP